MGDLRLENSNFIVYQTDDQQIKVDVVFNDETVWLTLDHISELFDRNKSTISMHINNVFEEGELR